MKQIVLNDKKYNKIIHRCEFYYYEGRAFLVTFEPESFPSKGDIFVDEYGKDFEVMDIAMLRYAGGIPEWYLKVFDVVLKGENYNIGEYLSKKE